MNQNEWECSLAKQLEEKIKWIEGMPDNVLRRQYWGMFNEYTTEPVRIVQEKLINHFREATELAKTMRPNVGINPNENISCDYGGDND